MKIVFNSLIIFFAIFSIGCQSESGSQSVATASEDPGAALEKAAREAHAKLPMIKEIQNDKVILDNGKTVSIPTDQSVIFMVRHAETTPGDDTETRTLSEKGSMRAEKLKNLLQNIELAGILSTSTVRASQTAQPTADAREKVGILSYNQNNTGRVYDFTFGYDLGKRVMLVGHSNTVPAMIRELTANDSAVPDILHDMYDNLYIVSGTGKGKCTVNHFRF